MDATLNSVIVIAPGRPLADARAAEARMMAGTRLGPLDGIPIAHNHIHGTKGLATTAHSKPLLG